jgi:hypothetical protein
MAFLYHGAKILRKKEASDMGDKNPNKLKKKKKEVVKITGLTEITTETITKKKPKK